MHFALTTLGVSAAGPIPGRWPSGQYLRTQRTGFLIDCGEGIQIALQSQGIGWSSIAVILISHLHGDHIYGLPGLLTSWALNRRTAPLTIIGPEGLDDYLQNVFRTSHTGLTYPLTFVVVDPANSPEVVFTDDNVEVKTLPLLHRIPTVGYLVKELPRSRTMRGAAIEEYGIPYTKIPEIKAGADFMNTEGRVIANYLLTVDPPPPRALAYCSDTRPNSELVPLINGVDILFHEATFLHELADQAEMTGHSTARQAAEIAEAAQVGRLIIGHFSSRYVKLSPLLAEAEAVFEHTALAEEGMTFAVAYGGRAIE